MNPNPAKPELNPSLRLRASAGKLLDSRRGAGAQRKIKFAISLVKLF